jgi:tetratricopeptide (TPR) repeat protein
LRDKGFAWQPRGGNSSPGLIVPETVFRLFVSSPGDVAAERARAEAVVEKLNEEFKDHARLDAVFWEDHFYSAHETFQRQIPEAAACDLVIAIFRARLGSPLPDGFPTLPDGEPYPSGTAYEVLTAIAKRHDGAPLPDIYVFRYPRAPQFSADDPKRNEIDEQWASLKDFFARWFKTAGGQFVAGFQSYESADDFADQIERCLREWLARRGISARETWDRARQGSPFPGLAAFGADREHVFFGRDLAIRQATERLREARTPFLLILGASGAGKSSLLRAALMPKLARPGAIPEVDLFRSVVMTPRLGLDLFAELAEELLKPEALGGELAGGRFAQKSALTEALRGDPATAAAVIGEALDKAAETRREAAHFDAPRPARLLLAVDQAERLFAETPKDAGAFAALLKALASGVAYVVMVMRADAYGRFQAYQTLLALRAAGATFDLIPPTAAELEEIVERPVAACEPPLAFGASEPPLGRLLVADAKGGDALPLLQMTLEGLYKTQEARGDGLLRAEDYKGMAAAVTETANAAMKPLGDGGHEALKGLVAALVVDVAADPVTAEPWPVVAPVDRIGFVRGKPERDALVKAFEDARLLTSDGTGRVRPTHDALLRIWPEAAGLVKEMGPLIRSRHALAPLAQAWADAAASDKASHLELSLPLLAAGQQLTARFGEDLGTPLQPFIAEALKAELRKREGALRRRRTIFGATLAALVVMSGLAVTAFWQRQKAVESADEAVRQSGERIQSNEELLNSTIRIGKEGEAAKAIEIYTGLLKQYPNRTDFQRELSAAYTASGYHYNEEKGLLADAMVAYLARVKILESLTTSDSGNANWQSNLAATYGLIGDVKVEEGMLSQALVAYQASVAILDRLTKSNPGMTDFQYDLAASYAKVGDVERKQDQIVEALGSFRASLAVLNRLTELNPGITNFQSALAASYAKIGDIEVQQKQLAQALDSYQASIAILDRLGKFSPGIQNFKTELAARYENMGDVEVKQGKLTQALETYRASVMIINHLTQANPDEGSFQCDLAALYGKIGDVQVEQGQLTQGLDSYWAGIRSRLRSLGVDDLGQIETRLFTFRSAVAMLLQSSGGSAPNDRVMKQDVKDADQLHDLSDSYKKLALIYLKQDQNPPARDALKMGREILDTAIYVSHGIANWKDELDWFDQHIASMKP